MTNGWAAKWACGLQTFPVTANCGKGVTDWTGDLRNAVLRQAARMLSRSGTFRRHLGTFDQDLDPQFLKIASLIRGVSDDEALFVRDLANAAASHADSLQDLWVIHEMRRKPGGFFLEFGAADGILGSTTLTLERDLGWRGILAEPNPAWHSDLRRNRNAEIDFRCVFTRTGERVKFAATSYPSISTILEYLTSDGHAQSRANHTVVEVKTVSLNDLLVSHAAPRVIDYISIDTEGSELDILKPFDFSRWDVQLFSIEHNFTPREQALDALMFENGYERRYSRCSGIDAWYRKKSR